MPVNINIYKTVYFGTKNIYRKKEFITIIENNLIFESFLFAEFPVSNNLPLSPSLLFLGIFAELEENP